MQINMTGHQMAVTPALRSFTEEKLDKLERHYEPIKAVDVVFDVEKLRQIAEATVHIAKGEVHAISEADDMYKAVDNLIDKLDRQLIKHKEKTRRHRE